MSSQSSGDEPSGNDQLDSASFPVEHDIDEEFGEPVSWTMRSSSLNADAVDEEEDDEENQPKTYEFHIVSNIDSIEKEEEEEDDGEILESHEQEQKKEELSTNNPTTVSVPIPKGEGSDQLSGEVSGSTADSITINHSAETSSSTVQENNDSRRFQHPTTTEDVIHEIEDDEDEGYSIPMHQVEQLVSMRLRQLDRDYDASLSVDISQPLPSSTTSSSSTTTGVRNPRIAASLATRPDLAAKMEALHRMAASMAMGTSSLPLPNIPVTSSTGVGSGLNNPRSSASASVSTGTLSWETFDDGEFPDDYGELQSQDSKALRTAKEKEEKERLEKEALQYAKDIEQAQGFEPFPQTQCTTKGQITALKVRKESSLTFIGDSPRVKPKSTSSSAEVSSKTTLTVTDQFTKANAQLQAKKLSSKLPPVRAVSPLANETRSAIQESMSRIHITPKGGPPSVWLEQTIQQALQRGKQSIETYQQQQSSTSSSSKG